MLEKEGFQVEGVVLPTWLQRLRHTLFGCEPIKYFVLDTRLERAVEMGRICPLCFKEFPIE